MLVQRPRGYLHRERERESGETGEAYTKATQKEEESQALINSAVSLLNRCS